MAFQTHFTLAELEPFDPGKIRDFENALRELPFPNEAARGYVEKHMPRLARTLAIVPPPFKTGRILELGCYMQITPFLESLVGYREVRGAYLGPLGRVDHKSVAFPDWTFNCRVDHFNVETDRFPYVDGHFDSVLAGELIEHLLYDPMHMLLECRRILVEGGHVVITTPNIASVASVAKSLGGESNPQIHGKYTIPQPGENTDTGHMREYTAHEVGELMRAAGFEVETLFTTFHSEYAPHRHLLEFLERNGYSPENRGEQIYCVATKRGEPRIERFPGFLYE